VFSATARRSRVCFIISLLSSNSGESVSFFEHETRKSWDTAISLKTKLIKARFMNREYEYNYTGLQESVMPVHTVVFNDRISGKMKNRG